MINLQKVLALMGIHNLTSVFLRIINRIPEHLGLSVGFFPLTLLDLITSLKAKHSLKKTGIINIRSKNPGKMQGNRVRVKIAFYPYLWETMHNPPYLRQGNVLYYNYNSLFPNEYLHNVSQVNCSGLITIV